MKKLVTIVAIIFAVLIGVLYAGPFFVVHEGEQAVVTQFGRIVNVVSDAGLKFKVPFIDEVFKYPKRILKWDGDPQVVPTAERQLIFVDVTARWRISDPRVFYVSVGSLNSANSRLTEIIDSEVRTVVAENFFRESVRNSNLILERDGSTDEFDLDLDLEMIAVREQAYETVMRGRRQLAEEMLERSRRMMPEFGIELIDIVMRQIRYSPELTPSVHARMTRERNQQAMGIRSDGEGRHAEWLGRMDNEFRSILSGAYAQAETIRGTADAEAARIYASAYSQDPSFFTFWRAMESYKTTLPHFNLTLSTDSEYFRHLFRSQ